MDTKYIITQQKSRSITLVTMVTMSNHRFRNESDTDHIELMHNSYIIY